MRLRFSMISAFSIVALAVLSTGCASETGSVDPEPAAAAESALGPTKFKARWVPQNVYDAVRKNDEIGRGDHDMGRISSLRVYDVLEDDVPVWDIMQRVLLTVGRDGSLGGTCKANSEAVGAPSASACGAWLMRTHSGQTTLRFIKEDMRTWFEGADDGEAFRATVDTIAGYIEEVVGRNHTEIGATMDVWSVDVRETVFISADRKRVIVLELDYGA